MAMVLNISNIHVILDRNTIYVFKNENPITDG